MVLVAVDDPAASTQIWQLCKARRIPANIADVPPECDFYFGSVHRDGPLQIMVSTNGKGPRLASLIRKFIAARLPSNAGKAIETVGRLRARLRQVAPRPEDGPSRMAWMTKVSDAYPFDEMCGLSDEDIGHLLGFYPSGKVPSLEELKAMRATPPAAFDGSFGFSVGA
jgi:precorrin-2 dehydrogenase/sirohydrochlorin ferrochelatase